MVFHLNPVDINFAINRRVDREFVKQLDLKGKGFPVVVENYQKTETKSNIDINVFGSKNKNVYPIYISKKLFE